LLFAPLAVAQDRLGELLDAGGKLMSREEIRQELIQRVIVGPTASGGNLEIIYAGNGLIEGRGSNPMFPQGTAAFLVGDWKIDDSAKFCTNMRSSGSGANPLSPTGGVGISRCQFWFKYKEQYFLADSDTDRQARVLVRTVKQ
jgi:hypothetical protein